MRIANLITLSRILLAPVFVFCFTRGTSWGYVSALAIAITFEVTDLLDGPVARHLNQVTDLGKCLDPAADSISRFTIVLCFLYGGYATVWAVAIFFWRDSLVGALRVMGATRNVIISARPSGKIKAWVQGIATISILCFIVWPWLLGVGEENVPALARTMNNIAAGLTFLSLIDYLWGNWKVIRSMDP